MTKLSTVFEKYLCSVYFFISLALVLIISCRKIDIIKVTQSPNINSERRFFTEHLPDDALVKSVLGFVKRENEKKQFVHKLINKIGYPYWDKAIVKQGGSSSNGRTTSDSTNTVFIPFVLDNANTVNNTLIVLISPSDTNFLLLADWQYANQSFGPPSVDSTAENVALLFMMEDKNVFGYDRFTITDSNLFRTIPTSPNYDGREIRFPASNARTMLEYEVEVCFNTYSCPYPWDCRFGCDYLTGCIADDEPYCQLIVSVCWYYTYDVDMGQWSTGGGGGPEGGGGAGGGWNSWDPPICEEEPQGRSMTYQDCGPGWTPPGILVEALANQSIIDSLQGYPCAQGILAQLPSINDTAKAILKNVFGVDSVVNITFIADSTLPQSVNAVTQPTSIQFNPTTGFFNIKIKINTWVLKNSSKEFIIKTMFHEAIHAFIDYHWKKYTNGLMDSTTFKQQFPKIWDYKKTPYNNLAQHTEIATSYVDDIMSIVRSFNSLVADSTNKAISWSGLYETQAWKDLGSDTIQLNRLRVASRSGTQTEMQALNLVKCN